MKRVLEQVKGYKFVCKQCGHIWFDNAPSIREGFLYDNGELIREFNNKELKQFIKNHHRKPNHCYCKEPFPIIEFINGKWVEGGDS